MSYRRYIMLAVLFLSALVRYAGAQGNYVYLTYGDTIRVAKCESGDFMFVTPYRQQGNLSALDTWLEMDGTLDLSISLRAILGTFGYITMTAGDSVLLDHLQGIYYDTNILVTSWPMKMHIHYNRLQPDDSDPGCNTRVHIERQNPYCRTDYANIRVSEVDEDHAVIKWDTAIGPMMVWIEGQDTLITDGTSVTLDNLEPYHVYTVYLNTGSDSANSCCEKVIKISTDINPSYGCFNSANISLDNCICTYGEPGASYYGIVDEGPTSKKSCHTVMTDTTWRDPKTGIRTVCPGFDSSVRLGNWDIGGKTESIAYKMTVDTTLNSILTLHYAAVLQNPDHVPEFQPRFTFDILDDNMMPVDSVCGHADFVANTQLGWSAMGDILYKDWTAVGIDLSAYHGRTIYLSFRTYDCALGGHFGYAYFVTECSPKIIRTTKCGYTDDNTYIAPLGYNYLWYLDNPAQPLSTAQKVTIDNRNTMMHCRLTSLANPDCQITMKTYLSTRFPKADATYTITTEDCSSYTVHFENQSVITSNGSTPLPSGERCDSMIWYFGDGTFSTEYNPTHVYAATDDTIHVTLVAILTGGMCADSMHMDFVLPKVWIHNEVINACDSLLWHDGTIYRHDTTGLAFDTVNMLGCEWHYTLDLQVRPSYHAPLERDTICYGELYSWRGRTIGDTLDATHQREYLIDDTLHRVSGCDSIISINLVRSRKLELNLEAKSDCEKAQYLLTATADTGFLIWYAYPSDTSIEDHPNRRWHYTTAPHNNIYTAVLYLDSSPRCMVSDTLSLRTYIKPDASLRLGSAILSLDNLELHAYDISNHDFHRNWTIVTNDQDSTHLDDTSRHIIYLADMNDYRITVILAVDNGECADTMERSVPVETSTLFAPNVFTPDQETNNVFCIKGNNITVNELNVYNRWGLLVYSSKGVAEWDGTSQGRPCHQDAYVWHLTYIVNSEPQRQHSAVGTVTLVR